MMISKPEQVFALQAKLFRGLSDHSRLAILESLRPGPMSVGQVVEANGLSQSNTSNHLRCLSDCGLVTSEQRGRFIYYRLSDPRIEEFLRLADEFIADTGRRIYACTNYDIEKANRPLRAKNGEDIPTKVKKKDAKKSKRINSI